MYSGLLHFTNLQGLAIDTLNHGAGASLSLSGINTMGVVNTEADSEIMLEDNEDGAGSSISSLQHAGSLTAVGNHKMGTATTTAGSKMVSHGQRVKGAAAAAPAEEPQEEAAPEEAAPEEEAPELMNLVRLLNLQGLQIGTLNHGAGASLELKGINTLGVVNTEEGSEIMLEDNEEGEGSNVTTLQHAGSLTAVGNHKFGTANTTAGSKMVSHGQRVKGAAAPAQAEEPEEEAAPEEAAPEEEAPEEEEEEELMNLVRLLNLKGLQIKNMKSEAGSSVHMKGTNSIEAAQTEGDSEVTLEGEEDGRGTAVGSMEVGGSLKTSGDHTIDDISTKSGSQVHSAGGLILLLI